MKKYFVAAAILLTTATFSANDAHAQYTYFPPISGQSAQLNYGIQSAQAGRRADSLRHARRHRKSRTSKRTRRSRRHFRKR